MLLLTAWQSWPEHYGWETIKNRHYENRDACVILFSLLTIDTTHLDKNRKIKVLKISHFKDKPWIVSRAEVHMQTWSPLHSTVVQTIDQFRCLVTFCIWYLATGTWPSFCQPLFFSSPLSGGVILVPPPPLQDDQDCQIKHIQVLSSKAVDDNRPRLKTWHSSSIWTTDEL